jgi:hypothetical protein
MHSTWISGSAGCFALELSADFFVADPFFFFFCGDSGAVGLQDLDALRDGRESSSSDDAAAELAEPSATGALAGTGRGLLVGAMCVAEMITGEVIEGRTQGGTGTMAATATVTAGAKGTQRATMATCT